MLYYSTVRYVMLYVMFIVLCYVYIKFLCYIHVMFHICNIVLSYRPMLCIASLIAMLCYDISHISLETRDSM